MKLDDPETTATLREAFGVPEPGPPDLEDVAAGLFGQLTPAEREAFRLIWARLCAVGRQPSRPGT